MLDLGFDVHDATFKVCLRMDCSVAEENWALAYYSVKQGKVRKVKDSLGEDMK